MVPALRDLGFKAGSQMNAEGAGYFDQHVLPTTGKSVSDLTDAIKRAIHENRAKLESHDCTELFMFVDTSIVNVYAVFDLLEAYVGGRSRPGPIALLPTMRCVWLCALNRTDSGMAFDVWRADGAGDGNWSRYRGDLTLSDADARAD